MDTIDRLSRPTVVLHWLIALSIVGLLCIGFYMTTTKSWWLFDYHKSIGVLVFAVASVRVVWRYRNGWPAPVGIYSRVEQVLAKLAHWILILGSIAMPVSGMLTSGASGHGFGIFGLELVPARHPADNPNQFLAYNAFLAHNGEKSHQFLAYLLSATALLHVAGALKHHLVDRDRTLLRMLGRG